MALRSIFMDGSPRGRAPGRVGPLVIADDGRSAVFVCEPPSAWRRVGRLSLDDGAVTFLDAPLSGNYQRVSTRPEAVFYSNHGPGCGVVDLASGRAAAVEPTPPGYLRACSPGGDLLATEGPGDRRLTISRRDDGAPIAVFDPGLAAFTDDGRFVVAVDQAGDVRALDVRGTPRRAATHAVETGLRHIGLAFDTPTAVRVVSWRWDAEGARLEARWLGLEGHPSDAVTLPRDYDHLQVEGAPGAFLTHRGDTILEARRVIGRDRAVTRVVGRLPASDALLCAGAGVAVCLVDRGSTPTLVALCLDDGRELGHAPAPRAPYLARVSPDGRRVAVAYADGGVEVFAIPAPEAP